MKPHRVESSPESQPVDGGVRFPPTSWPLLAQTAGPGNHGKAAVSEIAERYYTAVRAYISAIVRDSPDAEELTQQFFLTAIFSGRLLQSADPGRGRFRFLLKQAIRNFIVDERRRRSRKKNGSGEPDISPDGLEGGWDLIADSGASEPDEALLRAWGQSLVRMALARVEAMCLEKGQEQHFRLFAGRFLADSEDFPGWRQVGDALGLDEKTARSKALVVMDRFRAVLRELIATDAGSESDVDQEIRSLMALL